MERVAQAIIEEVESLLVRGYERYGLFFADSIGYRISPDDVQAPLFYGEVKIDAEIDTTSSPHSTQPRVMERSLIDPMLSPPLPLLNDSLGSCRVRSC